MKDVIVVDGIRFFSPDEVARKCGASPRTVERWIYKGWLRCYRPAGHPMVSEKMLREFLETPRPQDREGAD